MVYNMKVCDKCGFTKRIRGKFKTCYDCKMGNVSYDIQNPDKSCHTGTSWKYGGVKGFVKNINK